MHRYWQNVGKDNYKLFFVIFRLSYGPWLMPAFCFHLISWEQMDGFWWNFVNAVLWLTHEILPNFSTELWSLIYVKISIFLNTFRNNEWILIKFCFCINKYDPYPLFSQTFQLWPLIDFRIMFKLNILWNLVDTLIFFIPKHAQQQK